MSTGNQDKQERSERALPAVLRAIDELEHLVESSNSVPLTRHKAVDEDTFFVLTTRLKSALPKAIAAASAKTSPRLRCEDVTLLIVDVQERLLPAMFDAERVSTNCVLLARAANQLHLPIVITEQYPEKLGSTITAVREAAAPVFDGTMQGVSASQPIPKMLFSACTEKALSTLREIGRSTILLCGLEAHVCVLQSTLDLIEQGFTVFAVYDAIASRLEHNKQIGWERMMRAGVIPTSTESAIFELLREAGTPDFKALLPLLK